MKLVSYNIGYGVGPDGTVDLDGVARAIDGADVIALQEVERFWPRSGMMDQPGHGRIDYALVSPELVGRIRHAWVDREAAVSDHLPLWFDIDV